MRSARLRFFVRFGLTLALEAPAFFVTSTGIPVAHSAALERGLDVAEATDDPFPPQPLKHRVPLGAIPPKLAIERLDGPLGQLAAAAREDPRGHLESVAETGGVYLSQGLGQVGAEVPEAAQPGLDEAVIMAGGVVETRYQDWLQARVLPQALEPLASTTGVQFLRSPHHAIRLDLESEGLPSMGLDPWRAVGLVGEGARVPVLDLGFDGYTALLGSRLPAQVIARSFRQDGDLAGGGDPHGTAAAEIVAEVAPAATLYLVNFGTEVELGNAVDWLIAQGVQVASVSVGFPGTAWGDGRATVNGMVRKARCAGILWVQGAGNFGQTHWTGTFNDTDGNGFHNFAPDDEGNTIMLRRARPNAERIFRVEIFLTWDDWDCKCQDYDLFLFRGDAVVAQSTAFQNGTFPPVEHIVYTTAAAGDYWIAIQKFRASRRVKLDLVVTIDYNLEYLVPAESLVVPADSPDALTVGAAESGTLNVRPYSSRGPTKDGRTKPDLVAADQVIS